MSDKPKRTLTEEQKEKMQAAAKAARDKRKADEEANPALREERLAKAKAKREAKKGSQTKEDSDDEHDSADSSATPPKEQPKKERKKLSPEAQAAAIAKRKATMAAKKAIEAGLLDDDVPEDATAEDINAAAELMKKAKGKKKNE